MILADRITLEHVRLRRARVEAPIARLRLSHALSSASLKPRAMPPSAILIVRAMGDPLPGKLTKEFAPASLATAEWERAAQDSLSGFYRSAARPLWEIPSSGAQAVVFADYGEMLACLARDLASGRALGWWWRSILPRLSTRLPGSWAAAWMEHPLFIPAALECLEAQRQAVQALGPVAPLQAWRLLAVVSRAFNLPTLPAIRDRAVDAAMETTAPGIAFSEHAAPATENAAHLGRSPEVTAYPWEPYVSRSSTPPRLGYERQALLGIGLLLHRAPHAALRSEFPLRFRAWVESVIGQEHRHADFRGLIAPDDLPRADIPAWEPRIFARSRTGQSGSQPEAARLSASAPSFPETLTGQAASREVFFSIEQSSPPEIAVSDLQSSVRTAPHRWRDGESTRAGGILYLVHFLRQAELLKHFDTSLGGWALLELLARCLLDEVSDISADPIWGALALLDGRNPGEPPGGFIAQGTYEAPRSWLADDASPSCFARFRSRGLEIWNEEGFLVLDSLDRAAPPAALPLRRKFKVPVRPLSLAISAELRRFLHFVLPYAHWRLGRALCGARLKDALLRKGNLYVTGTHVDLVMPLGEISVPVRMAGMDANPGWVPELSRVITFHFSQEGM